MDLNFGEPDFTPEQVPNRMTDFVFDQYHLVKEQDCVRFMNALYDHDYEMDYHYSHDRQSATKEEIAAAGLALMFNTHHLTEPVFVDWKEMDFVIYEADYYSLKTFVLDKFLEHIKDPHIKTSILKHILKFYYPGNRDIKLLFEREKTAKKIKSHYTFSPSHIRIQKNSNCTVNNYFGTTPSTNPSSAEATSPASTGGRSASCAQDFSAESSVPKKRGPKAKPLFANEDGSENTTRTKIEKERLRAYINDHKLGSRQLTTEQDNILLKTAVCFYRKWLQAGYVTTANNATPLVRFLTETCEIPNKSDKVSIANRLLEMLKSGDYDREIAGQVSEYF